MGLFVSLTSNKRDAQWTSSGKLIGKYLAKGKSIAKMQLLVS